MRQGMIALLLGAGIGATLLAAVPAPPSPATYDATLRFHVATGQTERIGQIASLLDQLKAVGFQVAANDESDDLVADSSINRLRGSIASASARRLLGIRSVRTALLMPSGVKLPEDANAAVRVDLELPSGLTPERQRLLHTQTAEALAALKFIQAIGYDHRDFTRLLGTIPAGQVDGLLNDLRRTVFDPQPPLSGVTPLRLVEARPDLPSPAGRPALPAVPAGQEKLSDALRAIVADAAQAAKPVRCEILLALPPGPNEVAWQRALRGAAPGIALDGIVGTLVSATATANQLVALAALPEVTGLRPAQTSTVFSGTTLVGSGLEPWQNKQQKSAGVRLAIVGADFRGWEKLVGTILPAGTKLLDLTRDRNASLEAEGPLAGVEADQGTKFAQLALSVWPEADVVLVRVDPAAPYMFKSLSRATAGLPAGSLALEQRGKEIQQDRVLLDLRRAELLDERRKVFEDLREDDASQKLREEYEKKQTALDAEDRDLRARTVRYNQQELALAGLRGIRIVASSVNWSSGPDGAALAEDARVSQALQPIWTEPTSTASTSWTGLYRDADGNGAMEFTPAPATLAAGSWTRELNFVGWSQGGAKPSTTVPAGTRLRVTLRWREPHDPIFYRVGQDRFVVPLADFRLLLLRQIDPAGAKRPADDMEIVAQSAGAARRIAVAPYAGTYEISFDYAASAAERLALRVEGRLPEGDRPRELPTLPGLRRTGEMRPRITIATLEGKGQAQLEISGDE